jgi:Pectinacetylesterase
MIRIGSGKSVGALFVLFATCLAAVIPSQRAARASGPPYKNVAPPVGAPLPHGPSGTWQWVPIDGAVCRDGSATGFFVKFSDASKDLMIYLEGGGACFNQTTCSFTPRNVQELVVGETMDTVHALETPQKPWTEGIFDTKRADNPVRDWNMVYVPYCTGDSHSGTRANVNVPGLAQPQQFVGYRNMTKFLSRLIATFPNAGKVLLTGASAGGLGAAANFNQAQDGFGRIPVTLLDDSGPVFADQFLPACLQKKMRELWGLDAALPPDCPDCFRPDGGGLGAAAVFLQHKYPTAVAGIVSSLEDSVMRYFFSYGENGCTTGKYSREKYAAALVDLRDHHGFLPTQLGTFFYPGRRHTHIFRDRFYSEAVAGKTLAQWTTDLLAGKPSRVAPSD